MDSLNRESARHSTYTREFTFGIKYEFYVYLTSHIWVSSGLTLCEHQFAHTNRKAFHILHMRILFAEYNVRDTRISHPYRLSNNIKGNQRYITFIHASLLLEINTILCIFNVSYMRFARISPMWTQIRTNKPRSVQYITYANTSRRIQSPRYSNFAPRIVYQMMGSFNRYTALDNIYTREFTFGNKYEFYEYLASHIWDSSGLVVCEHLFV